MNLQLRSAKPITHFAEFDFGEVVYHRARAEKVKGVVTGVAFRPNGCTYNVIWGNGSDTWHFGFELTSEFEPDFSTA